jgi:hypothetical protein
LDDILPWDCNRILAKLDSLRLSCHALQKVYRIQEERFEDGWSKLPEKAKTTLGIFSDWDDSDTEDEGSLFSALRAQT